MDLTRPEPDDTRMCECGHTAAWHDLQDIMTRRWLCEHCLCFGFVPSVGVSDGR